MAITPICPAFSVIIFLLINDEFMKDEKRSLFEDLTLLLSVYEQIDVLSFEEPLDESMDYLKERVIKEIMKIIKHV